MSDAQGASGGALQSVVRSARLVVFAQLVVALFALGVTIWAGTRIVQLREERAQLAAERARLQEETATLETQRDEVLAAIDRAQRAAPQVLNGVRAMRDALADPNQWGQAVSFLTQAAAIDDGDAATWRLLAQAQYYADDPGASLQSLQRAVELSQRMPEDVVWQAMAQCKAGDAAGGMRTLSEAGADFETAAQAWPRLVQDNRELIAACSGAAAPALRRFTERLPDLGLRRIAPSLEAPGVREAISEAFRVRMVWLHISRDADRAVAERVRERLIAAGYEAPGVELVEASRYRANVRYYYDPQRAQAETVARAVQEAAAAEGIEGWARAPLPVLSLEGRFQGLPQDRVEVWLGPASDPAARPGVRPVEGASELAPDERAVLERRPEGGRTETGLARDATLQAAPRPVLEGPQRQIPVRPAPEGTRPPPPR